MGYLRQAPRGAQVCREHFETFGSLSEQSEAGRSASDCFGLVHEVDPLCCLFQLLSEDERRVIRLRTMASMPSPPLGSSFSAYSVIPLLLPWFLPYLCRTCRDPTVVYSGVHAEPGRRMRCICAFNQRSVARVDFEAARAVSSAICQTRVLRRFASTVSRIPVTKSRLTESQR